MPRQSDPIEELLGGIFGALTFAVIAGVVGAVESSQEKARLRKRFGKPGVIVGTTSDRIQVSIPRSDRMKHAHVVGATGSGKTTLLVNMAVQDIYAQLENGEPAFGVGVIDPKGDLVDRLLSHIPAYRARDVILFDPTDTDKPLGFNILQNVPEHLRSLTASQVVGTFKKLFGQQSWGQRLEHVLRFCVLTLLEVPGSTLLDIPTLVLNDDFREGVLPHVTNFEVVNFWENEFAHYASGKSRMVVVAPILNRIGPWVAYPEIRNIIGQTQSSFNVRDVMDNKKIFLARLPEGLLGEDVRQLMGSLLITQFQLAATSRADTPEHLRQPFLLYADEFQNFVTEASQKIVTEGRGFGLGLVVANQHEDQLSGQSGLRKTLERNVAAHLYAYKQDTRYQLQYSQLQNLTPDMEVPFVQLTPPPALPPGQQAKYIIQESRNRYGRYRDRVEKDIWRRRSFASPKPSSDKKRPPRPGTGWSHENYYDQE